MAERIRTLSRTVDPTQLHADLRALSPAFKGLCGSTFQVGDVIRVIDADNLTDAQVDAAIAATVVPTADQVKTAAATGQADAALMKAVTLTLLDVIDARHPANLVDRVAFRQAVITRLKALI